MEYAALIGGPSDGQRLDVTGSTQQLVDGASLITELGTYGPGRRTHYEGQPGAPDRLRRVGEIP
ncbi:hypothetical protein [Streptomyces atroolivaceus]|uniref:hypothetical protein n=1 Tax=Streptomyces atroolivaceus TaxID=66869 RepID=UPI00379C6F9E